jgi:putative transposase
MARKPRLLKEGGIYHIINRGVEKRDIFLDRQDYSRFIIGLECFNCLESINLWIFLRLNKNHENLQSLLKEKLQTFRSQKREPLVEVLAFVLMSNHYHLIVKEIKSGGISQFLKKMGGYSAYFNHRYDRVGPLFQSRFKSIEIQDERQMAVVFNYLHTNPVEMIEPGWKKFHVQDPKRAIEYIRSYPWSSYSDYIGKIQHPFVTSRDYYLQFLQGNQGCQKSVEDWIMQHYQKVFHDEDTVKLFLDA